MSELESAIERRAARLAKRLLGVESLKLNVWGNTGWPDREFFVPGGRPLFIEFKRPGEQPTPKQKWVHARLRKAGYQVETHDDSHEAFEAVALAVHVARLRMSHGMDERKVRQSARAKAEERRGMPGRRRAPAPRVVQSR